VRVLVTGGAGYIGSVTTARLLAEGHDVIVVDDLSTGHRDAVPPGAAFVHERIDHVGDVLRASPVEAVVHFAAKALVGESVADPALYWETNVVGSLALFRAARQHGVDCIVVSSTSATYGDAEQTPVPEAAAVRPTSPYGSSKLAVDLALADYATAYGLAGISLRYFNVAGALFAEGQAYGERHRVETHLIPIALQAASGERDQLDVYGTDYPTPDGTCVRDFVHVVDLADAHIAALTKSRPGQHEIVNLGSGTGYSVRDVINTIETVTGRTVPTRDVGRRAGDPAVTLASVDKAYDLLSWRPQRDLTQMVSDAWAFAQLRQ
jgi:UDP-glucose 4-epimerase